MGDHDTVRKLVHADMDISLHIVILGTLSYVRAVLCIG